MKPLYEVADNIHKVLYQTYNPHPKIARDIDNTIRQQLTRGIGGIVYPWKDLLMESLDET